MRAARSSGWVYLMVAVAIAVDSGCANSASGPSVAQTAAGGEGTSPRESSAAGSSVTSGNRSSTSNEGLAPGALANAGSVGSSEKPDAASAATSPTSARALPQLQRDFVDLRFGMFIHFGILTFCGSLPGDPCPGTWSQANLAITNFKPSSLYSPSQWAEAAVSAHMRFGVLTTRHHDGFALWPSAAGTFNVKSIPWKDGSGDVVRDYVDAFRSAGLLPGLYYSIWDNTQGIGNGPVTSEQLAYVKTQITELLSNYGPIPILVIDGWSWKMGHRAVPFEEIRELVKSLQPDCLLTDHTHLYDPWEVDIVNFEEPAGGFAPASNSYAAEQGMKINGSGGNDWFWAPNLGNLLSVASIVNDHLGLLEPRWTNFLLNTPPNRDGLLDPAIVTRLAEVGGAWSPNPERPALPSQPRLIEHPYTPVSATATSGVADNAIDGLNDRTLHTFWETAGAFPQSITLDLGQVRPDVGMLAYVPRYALTPGAGGLTDGAITSYGISVSEDGSSFTQAAAGTWAADGRLQSATFGPLPTRYVRLEVRAAMGAAAVITELSVGANR